MLIQDMLTGYVHEVPERSYGGNLAGYGYPYGAPWQQSPPQYGRVVYDGLGNPLGLPFIAALAPLAAKAVGAIAPIIAKVAPTIFAKAAPLIAKVGPNVTNVLPMASQMFPAAAPMLPGGPGPLPFAPAPPPMAFDPARPPAMSALPPSVIPAMPVAPGVPPYPVAYRRRRRSRRRVAIRRTTFAPPPRGVPVAPPVPSSVVEASIRTEPANTVSGYGYYGGFRGYGW